MVRWLVVVVAVVLTISGFWSVPAHADPDALWRVVHEQCVPHERTADDPAPCAVVNEGGGYALLKDMIGPAQYLLIPTERISGIGSVMGVSQRERMLAAISRRRISELLSCSAIGRSAAVGGAGYRGCTG